MARIVSNDTIHFRQITLEFTLDEMRAAFNVLSGIETNATLFDARRDESAVLDILRRAFKTSTRTEITTTDTIAEVTPDGVKPIVKPIKAKASKD